MLENLRINWEEAYDIGIVTHYKGKPFSGTGFCLHENGNLKEEVEMLDGLRHGKGVNYCIDGNVIETIIYKNDLFFDKGVETWTKYFTTLFTEKDYEFEMFTEKLERYIKIIKFQDDYDEIYHSEYIDNLIEQSIKFATQNFESFKLNASEMALRQKMKDVNLDFNNIEERNAFNDALDQLIIQNDKYSEKRENAKNVKTDILSFFPKNNDLYIDYSYFNDEFKEDDANYDFKNSNGEEFLLKIVNKYLPPRHYIEEGYFYLRLENDKLFFTYHNSGDDDQENDIKWEITDDSINQI
mgnify:CR=1 FL=1|tara:strand:+ start:321 stop:1211 length:891 start_codon:yes stop_codon:yes gene_type:complete